MVSWKIVRNLTGETVIVVGSYWSQYRSQNEWKKHPLEDNVSAFDSLLTASFKSFTLSFSIRYGSSHCHAIYALLARSYPSTILADGSVGQHTFCSTNCGPVITYRCEEPMRLPHNYVHGSLAASNYEKYVPSRRGSYFFWWITTHQEQ